MNVHLLGASPELETLESIRKNTTEPLIIAGDLNICNDDVPDKLTLIAMQAFLEFLKRCSDVVHNGVDWIFIFTGKRRKRFKSCWLEYYSRMPDRTSYETMKEINNAINVHNENIDGTVECIKPGNILGNSIADHRILAYDSSYCQNEKFRINEWFDLLIKKKPLREFIYYKSNNKIQDY